MSKSTQEFIANLKRIEIVNHKMPFVNELEKVFDYISNSPEMLEFLVEYAATFGQYTELFGYGLYFLEAAELEKILNISFKILEKSPEDAISLEVAFVANWKIPEVFYNKLELYFQQNPKAVTDLSFYPWKKANMDYVSSFKSKLTNIDTSIAEKQRFYECLHYSETNNEERVHLTKVLNDNNFGVSAIDKIQNYYPRQGFQLPSIEGYNYQIAQFKKSLACKDLLPIIYDNANYLCVYKDGVLRGKVCEWHHEEANLAPMFKSIESLFDSIANNPECDDWIDLPRDYPMFDDKDFSIEDEKILLELHQIYNSVKDVNEDFENDESEQNRYYGLRTQTAFQIFDLTPKHKIEELIPFLDDSDMFVQEYAIYTFGEHDYKEVTEKLKKLCSTAKHNGQMAASGVLKQWGIKTSQ